MDNKPIGHCTLSSIAIRIVFSVFSPHLVYVVVNKKNYEQNKR